MQCRPKYAMPSGTLKNKPYNTLLVTFSNIVIEIFTVNFDDKIHLNVGNTYFLTFFAHNNDNTENSYNICSQFFYSFSFLVALQLELILIYLGEGFLLPKLFFVYICSLFTDIICSLLLWLHIFFKVWKAHWNQLNMPFYPFSGA